MSLKGRSCWVVNIRMDDTEKWSLESIGRFVLAIEGVRFEAEDRHQLYGWVERVLIGQGYAQHGKESRGLLRRYIEKMTGLSRAQVTRLIARYAVSGRVQGRSIGGSVSRNCTRGPTSSCWPRSTKRTRR